MKSIIVIYSLFILVFSSYGQNNEIVNKYHNNLNLSYDLMAADNYHEALSVMNETMRLGLGYGDDAYSLFNRFLENIPVNDSLYIVKIKEYILLLAGNGATKKELKLTIKMVNNYGNRYRIDSLKPLYLISHEKLVLNEFIDKKQLKNEYKKWLDLKKERYDRKLFKKLKKIDRTDQKGRLRMTKEEMLKADSIVFTKFKKIIDDEKGFPHFMKIGTEGYEIMETILIHMSFEKIITFLPLLEEGIQTGNAFIGNGIIYAIDRCSIEEGKYLILKENEYAIKKDTAIAYLNYRYSGLGAFFLYDKEEKNRFLFPLNPKLNLKEINNIRSRFYIPSIKKSMEQRNYKLIDPIKHQSLLNKNLIINTYL
jgi:hypothetical protein